MSCSRLGTPPPRDWGGLQAATALPRLRARARSRRETPRRGASSEPGRFKGLTRSSTRPDGKLRHSFCEDAPAPRCVRAPERRACSPAADPASWSRTRPAPPAGAGRPQGSCLRGAALGGFQRPNRAFPHSASRPFQVFFRMALSPPEACSSRFR